MLERADIMWPSHTQKLTPPPHLRTAENKVTIVQLGGLEPLIRQMLSPNVEVQCNAVGCITNLATHGQFDFFSLLNDATLVREGGGYPLRGRRKRC